MALILSTFSWPPEPLLQYPLCTCPSEGPDTSEDEIPLKLFSVEISSGRIPGGYFGFFFARVRGGKREEAFEIARYCDTIAAIPHIVRFFLREVSCR